MFLSRWGHHPGARPRASRVVHWSVLGWVGLVAPSAFAGDRSAHLASAPPALAVAQAPTAPPVAPSPAAAPPVTGAANTELSPPELLTFVDAEYPAAARSARREADVTLRLSIDAEGRVVDAEVVEPGGEGFDEAARQAALRFVFRPARRGESAIPSRILYSYEFRLPAEPPPPPVAPAPLPAAPPPEAAPQPAPPGTLDVTAQGLSRAQKRRESAESVKVIETERARRSSADLGEVLARTEGVGVRRQGGLGSDTRFALNGLTDDQVRFFLDGIPLELSGFPQGIANVPVNAVERVEVYSGVVPVRFGADALGGAVNLVTPEDPRGTHAAASYEMGSYGTHRLSLGAQHYDDPTGLFVRGSGYLDHALNNYRIDVEVPDARGRLSPARVSRFHDAYTAAGGSLELGFVQRPWARRLILRGFVSGYDKEYQHNVVMTVPYGEVSYAEKVAGATLRYEQPLGSGVVLDALAGYSYSRGRFLDVAQCVYDWFGRCVRPRTVPGETGTRPHDQLYWDHSAFARTQLAWRVASGHALRLALAPSYITRSADERRQLDPTARDPLAAERKLLTMVNGVEYELDALEERLENIAFAKYYLQQLWSEEPRLGNILLRRDRTTQRAGIGDGLRFRWTPWLYSKLSYEWATRLPRPDEVFGDNVFIIANLELEPETSHNVNLTTSLALPATDAGTWRATASGFLRDADKLIVLLGNDRVQSYQNVYSARSTGIEAALGWSSRGELLSLDANLTYQAFRNTSSEGTFRDFEGDRIPNRPYLFANATARLQLEDVLTPRDELSLTWNGRYVDGFFRGWESVGLRQFKQTVPSQLIHSLGLGYLVSAGGLKVTSSFEVQNLTNEPAFDFFGVQRPGRAFYTKSTLEL
ncbi:MAG: hypothetical protein RL033_8144 [Pseudomonadota bacterium]|jgi:vitamin B12 transporter